MDGILPASGSATRMRGIPKFLLPCDSSYMTLLERHVLNMLGYCRIVWIPTRPELAILVETLKITSDRVVVLPLTTSTMTETILKVTAISSADEFMMCMPDTYFLGDLPYEYLSNLEGDSLKLATWRIREDQKGKLGQVKYLEESSGTVMDSQDKNPNCNYEFSWGAMAFNREILKNANVEMPHLGYVINPAITKGQKVTGNNFNGEYFDCGTPSEYLNLLKKVVYE
jgi:NDP-sugar pyrophosphorylase family protein